MNFHPEKINDQYIKLLERSNVQLEKKARVFSIKNVLIYSGLFTLLLLLFFSWKIYRQHHQDIFKNHLQETVFAPDKLLLQNDNKFYQIPEQEVKWLVNDALMIRINGKELQFINLSKNNKGTTRRYKIYTPSGKHYKITLTDNTEILLNANSQISFVNNRNIQAPQVTLQGEAFFKVAHRAQQKFSVKASGMTVQVYGTRFNLTNDVSKHFTRVALIKGSVKVKTAKQSKFIVPGEQAIVTANQQLEIKPADISRITAWIDQSFYFKNMALSKILDELQNRYQVQFVLKDQALQKLKFTGKINQKDDLISFLKMLEYTEGIHYIIKNNHVILTIK